jgi:hypothetical protein
MGGSDSMPVIVPSPADVMACARCVPTNRSIVKYFAYAALAMAIAIAVMVWFTGAHNVIYVIFALAVVIAVLEAVQAFFLTLRCGPCACG